MRTSNSTLTEWVCDYLWTRATGLDFDKDGKLYRREFGPHSNIPRLRIPGINAPVVK